MACSEAGFESRKSSDCEIPVVSLDWEEDLLVERVSSACEDWGFFQIVNHGLQESLLDDIEAAVEDFFVKTPASLKNSVRRTERKARGYFNNELTKQRPDFKEGFDVGFEGDFEIDGSNQWPQIPGFAERVQNYRDAVDVLAKRVLRLMVLGLGLPSTVLDSEFTENTSWMRLNYYPPCWNGNVVDESFGNKEPDTELDGLFSINRHTDAGALTVLYHRPQDPASLQVYSRQLNKFVRVAPVPGSFTINVGDAMQVWSNDRYRSPVHRVLAHHERERISIPYFLNPNYDAVCRSYLSQSDFAPHYLPFMWGEFRRLRFQGDVADTGEEIQIDEWRLYPSKL